MISIPLDFIFIVFINCTQRKNLPATPPTSLDMIPEETFPRTPEVTTEAFANLSQRLKARALVMLSMSEMAVSNSQIKLSLKKISTIQATGVKYMSIQNTLESIGLMYRCGSAVSNTHTLLFGLAGSLVSLSFHQRRPTNKRPATFLTFQKSAARSKMIMTKSKTLLEVKSVPKM